ncbi:MAG: DUF3617 family protein, partial [Deltaproteobacteria bacterium]
MIKKAAILIFIVFAMVSTSFAEPNLKEGKWEVTTTMEMPGMPMQLPPFTYTQCITKSDLVPENTQQQQQQNENLVWSTFYGGDQYDYILNTETNSSNKIWASGTTLSTNFPCYGGLIALPCGQFDFVLLNFNNDGYRNWATYFGGDT